MGRRLAWAALVCMIFAGALYQNRQFWQRGSHLSPESEKVAVVKDLSMVQDLGWAPETTAFTVAPPTYQLLSIRAYSHMDIQWFCKNLPRIDRTKVAYIISPGDIDLECYEYERHHYIEAAHLAGRMTLFLNPDPLPAAMRTGIE